MTVLTRKVPIGDYKFNEPTTKNFETIFKSGRITYGPFLREFEELFASKHQKKHAVFCVSGTSALHIALRILKKDYNWEENDEILVPALTFVASSNVILHEHLKPVFVDIEPDFFDMDPFKIEKHITSRTRAIMPVHLFGMPCRMDVIAKIAEKHKLKILEDCCQCTYGKFEDRYVGDWSEMSAFSTYCGSLIFTGVGGLVLTNSKELDIRARKLLAHGRDEKYLSIDDDDKLGNLELLDDVVKNRFSFDELGFSWRMTEFEGAMGIPQLHEIDIISKQRRENANFLIRNLSRFDLLQLPEDREQAKRVYRMFPIKIRGNMEMRNKISFFLERHGIETRPLLPLVDQPYYKKLFGDLTSQYPIATHVGNTGFYIGCHEYLSLDDLQYIVDKMEEVIKTI